MTSAAEIIAALERAPGIVIPMVRQAKPAILKRRPPSGKWSIHEHACHLAAVNPRFVQRLELMLTQNDPAIKSYEPGRDDAEDALLQIDLEATNTTPIQSSRCSGTWRCTISFMRIASKSCCSAGIGRSLPHSPRSPVVFPPRRGSGILHPHRAPARSVSSGRDHPMNQGGPMRAVVLIATLLACGSSAVHAQSGERANTRKGMWFGFGLGGGSAGTECASCTSDRFTGGSGYIRLGGTVSRSLLIGVETNGWLHSSTDADESIGFGSVVFLWYPSKTGAVYVKFGLGGMTYRADDGIDVLTATAPSASIGIGYEWRVGRNTSLVPYVNSLASSSVQLQVNGAPFSTRENFSLNLLQFGLGVTWH